MYGTGFRLAAAAAAAAIAAIDCCIRLYWSMCGGIVLISCCAAAAAPSWLWFAASSWSNALPRPLFVPISFVTYTK